MSGNVNIVVVTGNLVEAPKLEEGGGTPYARFRIGATRRWKNGAGELQERADFFDVVAFNGVAKGVAHAAKGSQVLVEGRLQLNQWKNGEGETRSRVEIVASQVQLLRKPREKAAEAGAEEAAE